MIADAYGFQFELVPAIANDIRIVCAGVQTVIFNAYRTLLGGGNIEEHKQRFLEVPTGASEEYRRSIFEKALALANTREAGEDGRPKNRRLMSRPGFTGRTKLRILSISELALKNTFRPKFSNKKKQTMTHW